MKLKRINPKQAILGTFVIASLFTMSACGMEKSTRNLSGEIMEAPQSYTQEGGGSIVLEDSNELLAASSLEDPSEILAQSQAALEGISSYQLDADISSNISSQLLKNQNFSGHVQLKVQDTNQGPSYFSFNSDKVIIPNIEGYMVFEGDAPQEVYVNFAGMWSRFDMAEAQELKSPSKLKPAQMPDMLKKFVEVFQQEYKDIKLVDKNLMVKHKECYQIEGTSASNNKMTIYIAMDTLLPVRIKNAEHALDVSDKSFDATGELVLDFSNYNDSAVVVPEEALSSAKSFNIPGKQSIQDIFMNFFDVIAVLSSSFKN
ncbi:MAG: hypothetical protein Q4E22_01525 [Coriobacteriia bacterium]|nr:hypothetical protein [Coriobacteriia bacterium]